MVSHTPYTNSYCFFSFKLLCNIFSTDRNVTICVKKLGVTNDGVWTVDIKINYHCPQEIKQVFRET